MGGFFFWVEGGGILPGWLGNPPEPCKKAKELDVAALVVFKHSKAWWQEVRPWHSRQHQGDLPKPARGVPFTPLVIEKNEEHVFTIYVKYAYTTCLFLESHLD